MTEQETQRKKIAYLGPEGSYTELATFRAVEILGLTECSTCRTPTVKHVIDIVDSNPDFVGVIPVENSIEGIVRESIDNLIRTKSQINVFQEVVLPISHCLISKSGDISKVKKIVSHPQALAQCQNYLFNTFGKESFDIELVKATSTSEAVRSLIHLDDSYASIGNILAARLYGMKVISEDINDEKDNKTRFVCIGRDIPAASGNDKTSLAFSTPNKAGALVDILKIFKEHDINLSYIDSRPSRKSLGEYTFLVDFDGHINDEISQKAVEKIKPLTSFFRFIGSYPKYID